MKAYSANHLPAVALWRGHFNYVPSTGVFTFAQSPRRGWTGKKVGTLNKGYLCHKLNGTVNVPVHRLIWAWMTGEWPEPGTVIDHVNRNKTDNRWANLRAASYQQNEANSVAKNRVGRPKGVKLHKHGKWKARITYNRQQYYLGIYDTLEEASEAYIKGAIEKFGVDWATQE